MFFCMREVSRVVSESFMARGSWPARATFYGGQWPATVREEGCGGWEKKHWLFGWCWTSTCNKHNHVKFLSLNSQKLCMAIIDYLINIKWWRFWFMPLPPLLSHWALCHLSLPTGSLAYVECLTPFCTLDSDSTYASGTWSFLSTWLFSVFILSQNLVPSTTLPNETVIYEQVLTYSDFLCPFTCRCLVTLVVGLINLI